MTFPKFSQWKQIFKILRGPERVFFLIFVSIAFLSAIYLAGNFYIKNTAPAPAYGGSYTEGIVGQPRFINPIYGETNDIDRTIIDLVYSGLFTYDKDGKIIPDLVKNYQISEDGKTYTFTLKDNLKWHDGVPLTADDVIYTIKTIQNSDYKSPLRANWLNIDAQKLSGNSFALALGSPYNSFLENCTIKIIPQHIWKNILPENFALSSYNLQPVGSGPYSFSSLEQTNSGFIKNLILSANHNYYNRLPYISSLSFQFFESKENLIKAANQKTIDGFSLAYLEDDQALAEKQIRQGWNSKEKFNIYNFSLPRYFAVFFNGQKNKILSDTNITKALNYSVNKNEFLQKIVNSPILPDYFGFSDPSVSYEFNTETANNLLDKSGYKILDSNNMRSKPNDKKAAFQFKSYLKSGSSGNEVAELQKCLAKLDNEFKNLLSEETNGKYGKGTEAAVTAFQKKYLPDSSPTGETGPGTRTKLNELCLSPQENSIPLKIVLTTINQPQLKKTAELLKNFWQKVGVAVEIKSVELSELKDIIKNRNYEALLYGQALGEEPDLYPFWYSSQINDPGLNLAVYQNKEADKLLKEARETLDPEIKKQNLEKLQNMILTDAPALFLYNPDYIYWVSGKIKGIDTTKIVDPAKRFANIQNWYINTKRIFK